MGQMSWLSHLIEQKDEKGLIEFLSEKGFKRPLFAAKEFMKAADEIEEMHKEKRIKKKKHE